MKRAFGDKSREGAGLEVHWLTVCHQADSMATESQRPGKAEPRGPHCVLGPRGKGFSMVHRVI